MCACACARVGVCVLNKDLNICKCEHGEIRVSCQLNTSVLVNICKCWTRRHRSFRAHQYWSRVKVSTCSRIHVGACHLYGHIASWLGTFFLCCLDLVFLPWKFTYVCFPLSKGKNHESLLHEPIAQYYCPLVYLYFDPLSAKV